MDDLSEEEAGYGIGAVARRLGVPAPTLRTWNLRYGIGPSRRSPGGHRRYDAGDLRRLEEMNRLIHAGVAPAEAAREALRLRPSETGRDGGTGDGGPDGGLDVRAPVRQVPSPAMLARAASVLDSPTVADGVRAALDRYGVRWTWHQLVLPVFEAITRKDLGIDVEHLFSNQVLAALHPLVEPPRQDTPARPVLLACAEDEQHSLPIYALAAVLTVERAVQTRVLGARTPYSALADAMRRLGPAVVFVWSQQDSTGDPAPLAALPSLRPTVRVVVGGPGWWDGLPRGVTRVSTLDAAVSQVMHALA
ncbi:MerR family transcriptional regulator [Nonomuraea dietziae]|uniref:DNA-binding transcriptional MerR regulator n=1 Tax=Nonomuraea dietziae TaxID=65515 RepID=A0A7W5Y9L7_9ACTN|nr:MerR family transcriptional regulator [Nonomuraea dietziae]MBB3725993.1 DNA-binding transcriptional MerR regulator [Nonomuraea dietziae]